ncbi:MAG: aminopeptidase P family protein [Acidobacteria bacterium]|nr:aminopeptidase P family protein [Acidobacteriota bacterium]
MKLSALCLLAVFTIAAHALDSVPKAEYRQRRVALAEKLHGGAAVLFGNSEPALEVMFYRQDNDFYYLSGRTEPGAAMLIIGAGPATTAPRLGTIVPEHAYREILFLPERNLVLEKYTGEKLDAASPNVKAETGFDEVMPLSALPAVLAKFVAEDRRRGQNFWWQQDMKPATAAMRFAATALGVDNDFPANDVRSLTMQLRSVKSPAEIDLIRKATEASAAGQLAGMKAIKPGVTENSVSGAEMAAFMKRGCERASYPPIVGAGVHSTTLHYSENSATIQKGDVVVIDEACEYSMYASDLTRTMPATDRFTARQKELYEIVLGAQKAAEQAFVAGKMKLGNVNQRGDSVHDTLDKVAYDYINTHGKDLHGGPLGKYFLHGLGHSVGLDVHDPFDYSQPLDKGNVFTIEPGVYIPEEKIGIRIENTYYVDETGRLINLSENLPREPADVEAAMR